MDHTESLSAPASPPACPSWCAAVHGAFAGEEDWIHEGEALRLADGVLALLRMSVDPVSGAEDGPYLFIGSREYTLEGASAVATSLLAMAANGKGSFASEQPERTRPVFDLQLPQDRRDVDPDRSGRDEQP